MKTQAFFAATTDRSGLPADLLEPRHVLGLFFRRVLYTRLNKKSYRDEFSIVTKKKKKKEKIGEERGMEREELRQSKSFKLDEKSSRGSISTRIDRFFFFSLSDFYFL